MSDLTPSAARAAIIATAAGIAGIRSTFPRLPDAIPSSPAFVLGGLTATYAAGQSRQRVAMHFPLRLYVERTSTDDRAVEDAEAFIQPTAAAFSQGVTLSGTTTTQLLLTGWNGDNWVTVGSAEYLMVEFTLVLETSWSETMTA